MKKLVSVTCPELDKPHDYLTSGNTYEVFEGDHNSGKIIDDQGCIIFIFAKESSHIENKKFILNYEPDTTERSKEIVSKLLMDTFHSIKYDDWSTEMEETIQAAKDFGLDELAEEMENCLK